ncbi:hypothetical protein VPNG_02619 [Cytospora leucostoma]|uniref:Zn(2)-C6 fungal-type domain-containing protein n=1 Tax=Cytospora leucostoma TaxID=1230097 RepID=A0A423XHS8_9PEZI|nr:hypothetical protein VPNG_02619 [Cytospora leucostoma]
MQEVSSPKATGAGAGAEPAAGSAAGPSQKGPQLNCASCRDRKLKCDKLDPCTNCTSSGLVCMPVYRPRLPRGRHAAACGRRNSSSSTPILDRTSTGRDQLPDAGAALAAENKKLMERLQWVETRVKEISSFKGEGGGTNLAHQEPAVDLTEPEGNTVLARTTPSASNTSLLSPKGETAHGTGNGLEDQNNLSIIDNPPDFTFGDFYTGGMEDLNQVDFDFDGGLLALGFHGPPVLHAAVTQVSLLPQNSQAASVQLCQVYIDNIDPIIKILHRPSLSRWMMHGERYLDYPEGHDTPEVLRAAVCYSASVSMTDESCQAIFKIDKFNLVKACRTDCETAISKSALLTSRDITVLQAFVLYLTAKRTEDHTTAVWALFALVVRIAKSLGLHQDVDEGDSFFNQQMRKRLWLTICLLDLQVSLAQLSEPLVSHDEVASALAVVRNINDSDFGPTTRHPLHDREGLTDITFALITYRVQLAGRMLHFSSSSSQDVTFTDPAPAGGSSESMFSNADSDRNGTNSNRVAALSSCHSSAMFLLGPEWRQHHVRQFEREALSLLHFCDPETSKYAWFTWHSTQCLISAVRLAATQRARLPCGQLALPATPMSVARSTACSEVGGDLELLQRALTHLEKVKVMYTNPRGAGYRWYIPMSSFATAVNESLTCTDTALLQRGWPVIEALYQRIEHNSQASKTHLEKLMYRMREKMTGLQAGAPLPYPPNELSIHANVPISPIRNVDVGVLRVDYTARQSQRRHLAVDKDVYSASPFIQRWSVPESSVGDD